MISQVPQIGVLEERLKQLDAERRELQAQIAQLRAESATSSQPLGYPAASTAPKTADEKVALFLSLFRCREDVFPKLWHNARTGKHGYSPACRNEWVPGICLKPGTTCAECPSQAFVRLNSEAVTAHLRGNATIGTYAIRQDDTCIFLACDFDGDEWQDDASAYQRAGREHGIDVAIERSRSGNGAHAWVFFKGPVPARLARQIGTLLLATAQDARPRISFQSYDRFFPSQDFLPKGGFGNLIALPLQKAPREEGNTVFLDERLEPLPEQWTHLSQVRRLSLNEVNSVLSRLASRPLPKAAVDRESTDDAVLQTDLRLLTVPDRDAESCLTGTAITLRLGSEVSIPLDGLPARLIARLKRLAAFPNPEFYKLNRMRLSTYGHPRIIFSGELQPTQLLLPRGVLDQAVRVLRRAGAIVELRDERLPGKRLRVSFRGTLTSGQEQAIDALKRHDLGVLVAPPGAGKTVIGCALVALRKKATLVLVHRQPLVRQWQDHLARFLGLTEEDTGCISGTKKNASGVVDVAMLKTLGRGIDLQEMLPRYGMVIVDECHHIPAASFEQVLKQIPARFVLGLTATPYRKDGLQKIILFQCGPTRYEMVAVDDGQLRKQVLVRETSFALPESAGIRPPIHVIWHHLVSDCARNQLIASDVVAALSQGRTPLVISDRKGHLRVLDDEIRMGVETSGARVFRLDGAIPLPARKELLAALHNALDSGERVCLLATASLIGEGFDLARLDALFLTMPISFKGRVVQYAGRLQRSCEGKSSVLIYDYLDTSCAVALKMYRNRVNAYRRLGYRIEEPLGMIGAARTAN